MLKIMRNNNGTRNIIIILVVLALASYVLFSFGESPVSVQGDTVAEMGEAPIKLRDIVMRSSNVRRQFPSIDAKALDPFVVNGVVSNAVLRDGASSLDLKVSDAELREIVIDMRTTPEGDFYDEEQWAGLVRGNFGMKVDTFEEYLRESDLLTQKFQRLFFHSAYVSEKEIEEAFMEQGEQMQVEMLVLNTAQVKEKVDLNGDEKLKAFYEKQKDEFLTGDLRQVRYVMWEQAAFTEGLEVSDADIQKYYDENQNRYNVPEQVRASHILIKVGDEASGNLTDEAAQAKIKEVQAELAKGTAFEEVAKNFSHDSTAARGGDLGFFPRGRMVPPFEKAAFELEIDQVSEPVKTNFGYHIIKKIEHQEARTKPLEEVKDAIAGELKRTTAIEKMNEEAQTFRELVVAGKSFEEAAQEKGLEVRTSDFFDSDYRSNLGPVLKNSFQVRRATFELKNLNDLSEPINGGRFMTVVQWVAEKEPETLDFDRDKQRISSMAEQIAGRVYIRDLFEEIRNKAAAAPEQSLSTFIDQYDVLKQNHFRDSRMFGASSKPAELDPVLDFKEDLYSLEVGEFVPSINSNIDSRFVLARVKEKQAADMTQLEEKRFEIADQLRAQKGNDLLSSYIFGRRKVLDPNGQVSERVAKIVSERN